MRQSPHEVTTLAYQCIVQRSDGAGFATTSCDRPIKTGRTIFDPSTDLRPGELVLSERLEGSSFSIEGGIASSALKQEDLRAGRWDGSCFRMLAGDWMNGGPMGSLCSGRMGQLVETQDQISAAVDLLPPARLLPACAQTSPECRAVLGDGYCRVDMRSRKRRVKVLAIEGAGRYRMTLGDAALFRLGRLRWLTGEGSGTDHLVVHGEADMIGLQGEHSDVIRVGDVALLTEGCDGRRATCSERFGNMPNFRGEPDLPGSNILLSFDGD